MIKVSKKIASFLLVVSILFIFSGCSLFGGTTEEPAQEGEGELLTGRLGQDFPSETVQAGQITVTTQKLELFKESNPALNKFYYGDQVPVFRFSAKPNQRDVETAIKNLLFTVNVTGNIKTSDYILYDLDNPSVALTEPETLRLNKTVQIQNIQGISIPATLVGEKKYELRVKIEKTEDALKAEPGIDVELTTIDVEAAS